MLNWEGVTDTGEDRGLAEKQPGGGQSWVGHQRAQCQGWPRPPAPSCAGEEELGLVVEKVAWWKGIDSGVLRGVRACPQGRTPRCHPGCWTRSKDGQEAELGKWLLVSGRPEGCGAQGASSVGALSRMSRWPGECRGASPGPSSKSPCREWRSELPPWPGTGRKGVANPRGGRRGPGDPDSTQTLCRSYLLPAGEVEPVARG